MSDWSWGNGGAADEFRIYFEGYGQDVRGEKKAVIRNGPQVSKVKN